MTTWTLIRRSLRFHARAHLGVVLGAAVGSAALIGALVVGDSVRGSLRDLALARLGRIQMALASGDRFFRAELARNLVDPFDGVVAPAMQLPATAATADGSARANGVQLLGVTEVFWTLALEPASLANAAPDEVVLSERLAQQLQAKVGDSVLVRVSKPSALSREAPITPQGNSSVALRVTVKAIVSDAQLGRFSLQARQVPPFNAFVSLSWLQQKLSLPRRANLLLVSSSNYAAPLVGQTFLRRVWQLADAELELRDVPGSSTLELRTDRVFLDPPVANAALKVATDASGILTYFVNELRVGDHATPYSMVTAMGAPVVPPEMRDNQIIINQWLADDLMAKPGDELELKYFVIGLGRRLEEKSARFHVHSIVPLSGAAADRTLMPDFPGLEKAESTRDWDSSLPVSLAKIRPKDDEYWKQYRGTPKAFITLAAGQKLWTNRFGNLTAVRLPNSLGAQEFRESIERKLLSTIDPAALGLHFEPVLRQALAAVDQSQDFVGLFIGFSFFLIVAALILMALLFQFGLEQRSVEVGTLLALGFLPKQVRRLILAEGCALALLGGVLGSGAGILYARAMLLGLTTVWSKAVANSALRFHVASSTLVIGLLASVVVSAVTLLIVLRRQARRPARELLAGETGFKVQRSKSKRRGYGGWIGMVAGFGGAMLIGWTLLKGESNAAGIFFGAGSLFLIAGLGFAAALLSKLDRTESARSLSLNGLGLRNASRRRNRSLATMALLACGSFLVVAVGANKLDANRDAHKRSSGTGGFALIGESTSPIVHDLNTQDGRDFFGLDANSLQGVDLVSFRVRDGDDASCLNLNRAQTPRLLGVQPDSLAKRGAFTFARVDKRLSVHPLWRLLNAKLPDGSVPAVGDEASIVWALGKKVGDTLTYLDERGQPFKVRLVGSLANSILQGSLVISEEQFITHFPGESGYRMFLIDTPSNPAAQISETLSRALQDAGLELTPTTKRLDDFNAVQNTYLNTFQVLGGLGLLLGSAGLGVVVLRNVLERRAELAVLLAVGFRRRALHRLVLTEHAGLLWLGLLIGIASAAIAVLPSLLSPGAKIPVLTLSATLAGVLLSGMLWTWLATRLALRGKLLAALRNE